MDIRKIKKLIELLEESSLTEMEIVEGEESVRLMRGGQAQATTPGCTSGGCSACGSCTGSTCCRAATAEDDAST